MKDESSRPGRITEIRDQVRDPERVSLFIDGEFRIGLPRIAVSERNLRIGQILTDEDLAELESIDEASRAINQALRLLGYRPRSSSEISSRLRRNGFSEPAIQSAIERMVEYGYVDDQDFARFWVENRQQHRPRGRRMLESELRQRGVSPDMIDQAIDEADLDEYGAARELAIKQQERYRGLEPEVWRRRMAGFLQRRGYGWNVVRQVLDELERNDDDG